MGPSLIGIGVSFEDSFNVLLPIALLSKARANFKGIAWCNLNSSSKAMSLTVVVGDGIRGTRIQVI